MSRLHLGVTLKFLNIFPKGKLPEFYVSKQRFYESQTTAQPLQSKSTSTWGSGDHTGRDIKDFDDFPLDK